MAAQPRHICDAAKIQFIRGVDEPTVPDVTLKRARSGTSGQALFVFDNPSIFQASSELGDITGGWAGWLALIMQCRMAAVSCGVLACKPAAPVVGWLWHCTVG